MLRAKPSLTIVTSLLSSVLILSHVVTSNSIENEPEKLVVRAKVGTEASIRIIWNVNCNSNEWTYMENPNVVYGSQTLLPSKEGATSELTFQKVMSEHNGRYQCICKKDGEIADKRQAVLLVTREPEIKIESADVDSGEVYLKWTVNDHNEPVTKYVIECEDGTSAFQNCDFEMQEGNTSAIVRGLKADEMYRFRITATNAIGYSIDITAKYVNISSQSPLYVPTISQIEATNNTITINLTDVPDSFKHHNYYYKIGVICENKAEEHQTQESGVNGRNIVITNLQPQTKYKIRVSACNYSTKRCGDWCETEVETHAVGDHASSSSEALKLPTIATLFPYFIVKYLIA